MVKIKICGLTNQADYNLVVEQQAEFTGFIFHPPSPRYLEPEKAGRIIREGARGNHQKVGVFVNETLRTVREVFDALKLDIVQLHGKESPLYCRKLNLPFWKVLHVARDTSPLDFMARYDCEVFVLDSQDENVYGGTGRTFDLKYAREAIRKGGRIIIAGGLGVDNIDKVLKLQPYAVDINSRLEDYPGKKSAVKLMEFFEKIKNYHNQR